MDFAIYLINACLKELYYACLKLHMYSQQTVHTMIFHEYTPNIASYHVTPRDFFACYSNVGVFIYQNKLPKCIAACTA